MNDLRVQLKRPAIRFTVGGFRPSDGPTDSWFGRVNLCAPGEDWPQHNGKPMHALCQINLTKLPFRPPRLDDLAIITVFIGPDTLPLDTPNGEAWCLRAYKSLDTLIPLQPIETDSRIKPFPMAAVVIEEDFPCHEDVPIELPDDIEDQYNDRFPNTPGFKLGGWPTLIQSEIWWAPTNDHPAAPEFVFQIDSDEKANWAWGHGGVGYFGRGTAEGMQDHWTISRQCL